MAYLVLATFKPLSTMPDEFIDALETRFPGFVDAQLVERGAWIEAQLRKRYDVPFSSPYPQTLLGWLAAIVTMRCYLKRGVDALDEQWIETKKLADDAVAEVKQAADSVEGLFDLPLRADTSSSAISKGGPLAYSEASPYVWKDVQAEQARDEDAIGVGTTHE